MPVPQWKRALLIAEELKRLDELGARIEGHRQEIEALVKEKHTRCHGCLLLAVYGLYKNGYIRNTSHPKAVQVDYAGFNGHYSLDVQHAFDAIELLEREPELSATALKRRLGGELSIYSFVTHFFRNGLLG